MKISLQQLNESYQALVRLAQSEFPKDQHKLAYKLSRVMRTAKTEAGALEESLHDLMRKCGFEPGSGEVPSEKLRDYNEQAKGFTASTFCEVWGDPIRLDEIAGVVAISPFDLALLDWLIIEEEQAQAATV